jgi:chromate transport protein ChrA
MLFCVVFIHAGFLPALLVFFIWCLPGAIGMAALAAGVSRIKNQLPDPVYALLSGLNSATVGIIALAAVQLAEKSIKDKLSRVLVIFGACAGLCYTALWYFPVLMIIGGVSSAVWDEWLQQVCERLVARFRKRKSDKQALVEENTSSNNHELETVGNKTPLESSVGVVGRGERRETAASSSQRRDAIDEVSSEPHPTDDEVKMDKKNISKPPVALDANGHTIPVRIGIIIMVGFFCKLL